MGIIDEEPTRKPTAHELGADLTSLSVEELNARIGLLRSEISRLEAEMEKKASSRRAADDFFRQPKA